MSVKRAIFGLAMASMLAACGGSTPRETVPVVQPEPEPERRCVKILFAGDIMAHMPQVRYAFRNGSYDFGDTFEYMRALFEGADIVVANLETTLSDIGPYSGYPCFRSPAALAEAAAEAGVDVLMLANNHMMDYGAEGVRNTVRILDRCGIAHTGTFADSVSMAERNPLVVERNGVKVAFLNYTYGTNGITVPYGISVNGIDTVRMAEDIVRARAAADAVVAYVHWGDEYSRRENMRQRQISGFLHSHGVRTVIGTHPHVVQPVVRTLRGVTAYSLGNFVSNQCLRYRNSGMVAEVDIVKEGDAVHDTLRVVPLWVRGRDYAVIPGCVGDTLAMPESERALFMQAMADVRESVAAR